SVARADIRPDHYPACYVEPMERYGSMLGFDYSRNTHPHTALARAVKQKNLTVTAPVAIGKGIDGDKVVVIVFARVREYGSPPDEVPARVKGAVAAVFPVDAVINAAISSADQDHIIDLRVADDGGEKDMYIFDTQDQAPPPDLKEPPPIAVVHGLSL